MVKQVSERIILENDVRPQPTFLVGELPQRCKCIDRRILLNNKAF
jgi:hypothetical protein